MKEELNIAAILKEKPRNTSLYSPIFGLCALDEVNMKWEEFPISVIYNSQIKHFRKDGRYFLSGEVCLFPSDKMRDWSKFTWKKGDVLVLNGEEDTVYCVFESFEDDEYTLFKSRFTYVDESCNSWLHFNTKSLTNHYEKASDEEAKEFIKKVEEHYGGKLNLCTLQIEKQPEFKDGDILTIEDSGYKSIIIYKCKDECMFRCYAAIDDVYNRLKIDIRENTLGRYVHPSTDSEKQQLFSALAKENKAWDEEKKVLVDLPKKCEFKPMDLCLMKYRGWELCQYAYTEHRVSPYGNKSKDFYHAVGGEIYAECIPYNDQTKHLLGTTDEWKGGEG